MATLLLVGDAHGRQLIIYIYIIQTFLFLIFKKQCLHEQPNLDSDTAIP